MNKHFLQSQKSFDGQDVVKKQTLTVWLVFITYFIVIEIIETFIRFFEMGCHSLVRNGRKEVLVSAWCCSKNEILTPIRLCFINLRCVLLECWWLLCGCLCSWADLIFSFGGKSDVYHQKNVEISNLIPLLGTNVCQYCRSLRFWLLIGDGYCSVVLCSITAQILPVFSQQQFSWLV